MTSFKEDREKERILQADATASTDSLRWKHAAYSRTERRPVWVEQQEKGEACYRVETGRGQMMQSMGHGGRFGFYSQWLAYRRILSRGVMRSNGIFKSHCLP